MQVQQIHIVSGHWIPFIFKICQTVAGIRMMRQFHDFFKTNFRWFFSAKQENYLRN